jgi:hypothetical protein
MIYPTHMTNGKLTKNEIENIQYMDLFLAHKKYLKEANDYKCDFLDLKNRLKDVKSENREALLTLIDSVKNDAIEFWNKSQEYLQKSIEFQSKRKYPNN